jgi:Fe2+ transport system protein FeoA
LQFRHRGRFGRGKPEQIGDSASLTCLREGETGVIVNTAGGIGVMRRLAEMGLTSGTKVKILRKCPFQGPLEVEVRGVTLAIGYGVACKVIVNPVKGECNG